MPEGYYHVHTRGNDRRPIYFGNWSGRLFVRELERTTRRHSWRILAYCLMGNHYHLVLQIDERLSQAMCELNARFARISNWVNKRSDHLFGARFRSHLIEDEAYLFESLRYVLLNPVRARVVRHPGNWRWASYAATVGRAPSPPCVDVDGLLELFGATRLRARAQFQRFVEDGIGRTLAVPRPVPAHACSRLPDDRENLVTLRFHERLRARLEVQAQERLGVRRTDVEVPVVGDN